MPIPASSARLSRRAVLRGAGVAVALPWLEAMLPRAFGQSPTPPRRMMVVYNDMSFMPQLFFPTGDGRDYQPSPYLQLLEPYRQQLTVFSGLSHPGVDGGHEADRCFLTTSPHPGQGSFRNSVSLDQIAAEKIGAATRFTNLNLRVGNEQTGLSWTRAGVLLPSENRPSVVFKQLFLDGQQNEVAARVEHLRSGRSVLDAAVESARSLNRQIGPEDRRRLDEYFTSVRELEGRMTVAAEWEHKPKPKVDVPPPVDNNDADDTVGRSRLMYDLVRLALQTDSSRIVTLFVQDGGANHHLGTAHHDLTHHGGRPEAIETLRKMEEGQLKVFGDFLGSLRSTTEGGSTLLDQTAILHGAGMGNANAHSNDNLPILLAGGGFRHGQHLAFDTHRNYPLANLFVSMLQRLGIESDAFGSSTGTLRGLAMA
ncbi:MAG TPA: DUF1552 domain-containing protein [Pirellulales bacterium]|jgi:hypothetical protein|nr:DUF1552 domain-containing protein [Pirellulales bacterium]